MFGPNWELIKQIFGFRPVTWPIPIKHSLHKTSKDSTILSKQGRYNLNDLNKKNCKFSSMDSLPRGIERMSVSQKISSKTRKSVEQLTTELLQKEQIYI